MKILTHVALVGLLAFVAGCAHQGQVDPVKAEAELRQLVSHQSTRVQSK